MHFSTDKCSFPKYGVEELLKLKIIVIQPGISEIELRVEQPAAGRILVLVNKD